MIKLFGGVKKAVYIPMEVMIWQLAAGERVYIQHQGQRPNNLRASIEFQTNILLFAL